MEILVAEFLDNLVALLEGLAQAALTTLVLLGLVRAVLTTLVLMGIVHTILFLLSDARLRLHLGGI